MSSVIDLTDRDSSPDTSLETNFVRRNVRPFTGASVTPCSTSTIVTLPVFNDHYNSSGTEQVNVNEGDADSAKSYEDERKAGKESCIRRPGIEWKIGEKLEAMDYQDKWYCAKILELDWEDSTVMIHFDGWNSRYDQWFPMSSNRMRPLSRQLNRMIKEKRKLKREYKIGDFVLAKWTDCRVYPAKVTTLICDGSYEVMFYDGIKKIVQPINLRPLPESLSYKKALFTRNPLEPPISKPIDNLDGRPPYKSRQRHSSITQSTDQEKSADKSAIMTSGPSDQANKTSEPPLKKHKVENETTDVIKKSKIKSSYSDAEKSVNIQPCVSEKPVPPPASHEKKCLKLTDKELIIRVEKTDICEQTLAKAKKRKLSEEKISEENLVKKSKEKLKQSSNNNTTSGKNSTVLLPKSQSVVSIKPRIISPPLNSDGTPRVALVSRRRHSGPLKVKLPHMEPGVHAAKKERSISADSVTAPTKKAISSKRDISTSETSETIPKPLSRSAVPPGDTKQLDITTPTTRLVSQKPKQVAVGVFEYFGLAIPPKHEFRIEQDHNQYKCTDPDCNKAFRKPSLLESHIKFYHSGENEIIPQPIKRRRRLKTASFSSTESDISSCAKQLVSPVGPTIHKDLDVYVKSEPPDTPKTTDLSQDSLERLKDFNGTDDGTLAIKTEKVFDTPQDETIPEGEPSTSTADSIVTSPCEVAKDTASISTEDTMDTEEDEADDEIVNCICRSQEEKGLMVQCEVCMCWQHASCFHLTKNNLPMKYTCYVCKNPPGVRDSQRYIYKQDWYKRGKLPRLVSEPVKGNSQRDVVIMQLLMAELQNILAVQHSVKLQLHALTTENHPEIKLWHKNWNNPQNEFSDFSNIDVSLSSDLFPLNDSQSFKALSLNDEPLTLSGISNISLASSLADTQQGKSYINTEKSDVYVGNVSVNDKQLNENCEDRSNSVIIGDEQNVNNNADKNNTKEDLNTNYAHRSERTGNASNHSSAQSKVNDLSGNMSGFSSKVNTFRDILDSVYSDATMQEAIFATIDFLLQQVEKEQDKSEISQQTPAEGAKKLDLSQPVDDFSKPDDLADEIASDNHVNLDNGKDSGSLTDVLKSEDAIMLEKESKFPPMVEFLRKNKIQMNSTETPNLKLESQIKDEFVKIIDSMVMDPVDDEFRDDIVMKPGHDEYEDDVVMGPGGDASACSYSDTKLSTADDKPSAGSDKGDSHGKEGSPPGEYGDLESRNPDEYLAMMLLELNSSCRDFSRENKTGGNSSQTPDAKQADSIVNQCSSLEVNKNVSLETALNDQAKVNAIKKIVSDIKLSEPTTPWASCKVSELSDNIMHTHQGGSGLREVSSQAASVSQPAESKMVINHKGRTFVIVSKNKPNTESKVESTINSSDNALNENSLVNSEKESGIKENVSVGKTQVTSVNVEHQADEAQRLDNTSSCENMDKHIKVEKQTVEKMEEGSDLSIKNDDSDKSEFISDDAINTPSLECHNNVTDVNFTDNVDNDIDVEGNLEKISNVNSKEISEDVTDKNLAVISSTDMIWSSDISSGTSTSPRVGIQTEAVPDDRALVPASTEVEQRADRFLRDELLKQSPCRDQTVKRSPIVDQYTRMDDRCEVSGTLSLDRLQHMVENIVDDTDTIFNDITEESSQSISMDTCRTNLMQHIMSLQDSILERLDVIEQHVTALEKRQNCVDGLKEEKITELKKSMVRILEDLPNIDLLSSF